MKKPSNLWIALLVLVFIVIMYFLINFNFKQREGVTVPPQVPQVPPQYVCTMTDGAWDSTAQKCYYSGV